MGMAFLSATKDLAHAGGPFLALHRNIVGREDFQTWPISAFVLVSKHIICIQVPDYTVKFTFVWLLLITGLNLVTCFFHVQQYCTAVPLSMSDAWVVTLLMGTQGVVGCLRQDLSCAFMKDSKHLPSNVICRGRKV